MPGRASPPAGHFSGDHTGGETPVPIPNTAVKPARPMIVPLARKSVIAGIFSRSARGKIKPTGGFFLRVVRASESVHAFVLPHPKLLWRYFLVGAGIIGTWDQCC